jgi:hypothetical protein
MEVDDVRSEDELQSEIVEEAIKLERTIRSKIAFSDR